MNAMVQKQGDGYSLLDLGFVSVGLDDAWQACGTGYHGSFHDARGHPLWNKTKFPDPAAMVSYAHNLSLKAGWYMNNCDCKEWQGIRNSSWADAVYRQSVAMLVEQQWDGVKLDSCSMFHNTSRWARLMEQSGRPIAIENCVNTHNPTPIPDPKWGHDGQCPYNWYRISTDIRANWNSVLNNLAAVVPYTSNMTHPMSVPGCWAYPDMMEVGRLATAEEDRSHFGAWCIISSPLILGCDLSDPNTTAKVWPIVSNIEAIEVNQQYAGHPGRLVAAWDAEPPAPAPPTALGYLRVTDCQSGKPSQAGFSFDHSTNTIRRAITTRSLLVNDGAEHRATNFDCVDWSSREQLEIRTCDGSTGQQFQQLQAQAGHMFVVRTGHGPTTGTAAEGAQCVGIGEQPSYCSVLLCENGSPMQLQGCHNGSHTQEFFFADDGVLHTQQRGPPQCVEVASSVADDPTRSGKIVMQRAFSLWAKPQRNGAVAVFLLSNQDSKTGETAVAIDFTRVGLSTAVTRVTVRDVWERKDLGVFTGGSFLSSPVGGHDSRFYVFKPS